MAAKEDEDRNKSKMTDRSLKLARKKLERELEAVFLALCPDQAAAGEGASSWLAAAGVPGAKCKWCVVASGTKTVCGSTFDM